MGLGFGDSSESFQSDYTTVDLLFKTEMWGKEYKEKKGQLLSMVKEWKSDGKIIPLFYHPSLHLIIVRLDHNVDDELAKLFYESVLTLDYEFEVYIRKNEEVMDVEF